MASLAENESFGSKNMPGVLIWWSQVWPSVSEPGHHDSLSAPFCSGIANGSNWRLSAGRGGLVWYATINGPDFRGLEVAFGK